MREGAVIPIDIIVVVVFMPKTIATKKMTGKHYIFYIIYMFMRFYNPLDTNFSALFINSTLLNRSFV